MHCFCVLIKILKVVYYRGRIEWRWKDGVVCGGGGGGGGGITRPHADLQIVN